eukprot:CAMPEP_0170868912 /NCGR_PEP_ID=MMETSP0734-20130129/23929_1 /TAXON_ID=186038 /ORGANISM="Fragilariopsis kerguelensis, Strain L26-C5" /LENGTH=63 /DNA_ID=CAMNT_0011246949 /DNA_START=393 /DNA_END=585 /DNA_ORIENTATION=-
MEQDDVALLENNNENNIVRTALLEEPLSHPSMAGRRYGIGGEQRESSYCEECCGGHPTTSSIE